MAVPLRGEVGKALFSTRDVQWHDRQRRLVNSAFSMTQSMRYEPWMDDAIRIFVDQLRKRFVARTGLSTEVTMEVYEWASYYALDVINSVTFGERVGAMEEGRDVNGVLTGTRKMEKPWLYVGLTLT